MHLTSKIFLSHIAMLIHLVSQNYTENKSHSDKHSNTRNKIILKVILPISVV